MRDIIFAHFTILKGVVFIHAQISSSVNVSAHAGHYGLC